MTNEEFIKEVSLDGEEWRDVVGYEGRYMVSSFGRIASIGGPYHCGNRICRRKPNLMVGYPRRKNEKCPTYLLIRLSNGNGGKINTAVHRLVAQAFISNPENLPFVNHKDECSTNNRADNLEWCTQQYNCNYGTHNARMAKTISETAYQRRKVAQIDLSGNYITSFDSITIAARETNIPRTSISCCCLGKLYHAGGYKWMYLSDYENLKSTSQRTTG